MATEEKSSSLESRGRFGSEIVVSVTHKNAGNDMVSPFTLVTYYGKPYVKAMDIEKFFVLIGMESFHFLEHAEKSFADTKAATDLSLLSNIEKICDELYVHLDETVNVFVSAIGTLHSITRRSTKEDDQSKKAKTEGDKTTCAVMEATKEQVQLMKNCVTAFSAVMTELLATHLTFETTFEELSPLLGNLVLQPPKQVDVLSKHVIFDKVPESVNEVLRTDPATKDAMNIVLANKWWDKRPVTWSVEYELKMFELSVQQTLEQAKREFLVTLVRMPVDDGEEKHIAFEMFDFFNKHGDNWTIQSQAFIVKHATGWRTRTPEDRYRSMQRWLALQFMWRHAMHNGNRLRISFKRMYNIMVEFRKSMPCALDKGLKLEFITKNIHTRLPMMIRLPVTFDPNIEVSMELWEKWTHLSYKQRTDAAMCCWSNPEIPVILEAWMIKQAVDILRECPKGAEVHIVGETIQSLIPTCLRTRAIVEEIRGVVNVVSNVGAKRDITEWHLLTLLNIYRWYRSAWRVAHCVEDEEDRRRTHAYSILQETPAADLTPAQREEFLIYVEFNRQLQEESILLKTQEKKATDELMKQKSAAKSKRAKKRKVSKGSSLNAMDDDTMETESVAKRVEDLTQFVFTPDQTGKLPGKYLEKHQTETKDFRLVVTPADEVRNTRMQFQNRRFMVEPFSVVFEAEFVNGGDKIWMEPLANRKFGHPPDLLAEYRSMLQTQHALEIANPEDLKEIERHPILLPAEHRRLMYLTKRFNELITDVSRAKPAAVEAINKLFADLIKTSEESQIDIVAQAQAVLAAQVTKVYGAIAEKLQRDRDERGLCNEMRVLQTTDLIISTQEEKEQEKPANGMSEDKEREQKME